MRTRLLILTFALAVSAAPGCSKSSPENKSAPPPATPPAAQPAQTQAPPPPASGHLDQFRVYAGADAGAASSSAGTPPGAAPPVSAAPSAAAPPAATPATGVPAPATPSPAATSSAAASTAVPPPLAQATPPGKPRTDNLVALEMGGRIDYFNSRDVGDFARIKLLDGNPRTFWTLGGTSVPQEVTVSFFNRDVALVSGVTLTLPPHGQMPIFDKPIEDQYAKDVEIWTSTEDAKSGFKKVATAVLPKEPGDHDVPFPAPVEARFLKIIVTSNYGSPIGPVIADLAVREAQAPGYVPMLQRHPDLASLLSTGVLPTNGATAAPAPADAARGDDTDPCVLPGKAGVHPTVPESKTVLIVAREAETAYAPFSYQVNKLKSPEVRYFPNDPGDGRVDSSIFERAQFWPVTPDAAAPAALVPGAGVDTVVLGQVCDIKTTVSDSFKRALVAWVAAGHKLILQDADGCGPLREPDYSFLPFSFATSNPGAQGAASVLRLIENSALATTDNTDPAFVDLDSWARKTNGNPQNDFGDSNTVIKYDPHWCGAIVGTNVKGANGFVLVYAHYGNGLIIYDGVDHDQGPDVAYRQYLARQLLLPFAPDTLPCSTHLSPFVVTTEASLVTRDVLPGQTYTYPISVLPVQPGFTGTVKLALTTPPGLGDLHVKIDPDTVSAGEESKATLSLTMPSTLPPPWKMAVRGTAENAKATLCLGARERKTGSLHVTAELGKQPAPQTRKNLLIILDLSGSMNLPLGKSTRIGTARQVLRDVLQRIPDDFKVGLRLYGHRYGSRQKETCTDSELRIPLQPLNRADILRTIDTTRPRGETPLVYSVLQAINDLKAAGGGSVVLITDGEESCGGDFAAAAEAIKASGLDFRLNIVGFTLTGQQARQQLGSLTASTGGAYYAAADGPALSRALVAATISRFPYTVYDANGTAVASGEAGDRGQELTAGSYRIVVQAGDDKLTLDNVVIGVAGSAGVRVVRKGDAFVLER
jgi:hypothetical protein